MMIFYDGCLFDKFDFIIGNPPYITYSELKNERLFLKGQFTSCSKGNLIIVMLFIEQKSLIHEDKEKSLI